MVSQRSTTERIFLLQVIVTFYFSAAGTPSGKHMHWYSSNVAVLTQPAAGGLWGSGDKAPRRWKFWLFFWNQNCTFW